MCVCVFLSPQYFETDDPEFYKSKVCFILNNDMSEMELVFAEEKYNKSGQLDKIVELMTGGAQTPVTNANKIFYLNLLAQYRLASQVKEEVEHFLKGGLPSPCASDVGARAAVWL